MTITSIRSFVGPFRALDYRFRVHSDIPTSGDVIERLFAPLLDMSGGAGDSMTTYELTVKGSSPRRYELLRDGVSIQVVSNPGSMLDWIIADMAKRSLKSDGAFVAVHSGVVTRNGCAVLLPAPPDHGKTTLVAALLREGFDFLSDEAALIDPRSLRVHPFPRPLVVSPESMSLLSGLEERLPHSYELLRNVNHHVSPDDIRPGCRGSDSRVGYVVAPSFIPGSRTRLEPLHRAEALELLLDQCFNLHELGKRAVLTLGDVVRGADCYRLTMGDLPSAIESIRALVNPTEK